MEFEVLKKAIAKTMNVDPDEITEETTFTKDLGADSLDLFSVLLDVEDQLKVKLYDEESEAGSDQLESIVTVGDAVKLIKNTVG